MKKTGRKYFSTIKNVANENNRWPRDIETYLASKIEAPANYVLDKIRNQLPITRNDKQKLAAYIVIMIGRVNKGLELSKEAFPKVKEKVYGEFETRLKKLIEENPSKSEVFKQRLNELSELKIKFDKEFPNKIWYQSLKPDAFPKLYRTISVMTWRFFVSDNKQPFLTSDNPVFFFKWLGVGKLDSEVTFPISSKVTLQALWNKNAKEGYIKENK